MVSLRLMGAEEPDNQREASPSLSPDTHRPPCTTSLRCTGRLLSKGTLTLVWMFLGLPLWFQLGSFRTKVLCNLEYLQDPC